MTPTTAVTAQTAAARGGAILVFAWLALTLVAVPAGAQYPPEPEIAVGTPGAVILIEGTDWGPGTDVTVTYRDPSGQAQSVSTTAEPDGSFSAAVTVPADAEPGPLPLTVSGTGADGAPKEWTRSALVVPGGAAEDVAAADATAEQRAGAGTPAGATPTTGTRGLAVLAAAAGLLAAGVAALFAARARSGSR